MLRRPDSGDVASDEMFVALSVIVPPKQAAETLCTMLFLGRTVPRPRLMPLLAPVTKIVLL